MTTDWWNTSSSVPDGSSEPVRTAPGWNPEPAPLPPAEPPEDPVQPESAGPGKPDRRKGLILGAAGAAAVGILMFSVIPHDGSGPSGTPGASVTSSQGAFPPAAGGGPTEGQADREEAETVPASRAAPKKVSLLAEPAGSGGVGAVVKVTIANGTDEEIIVMSSMVKGDGRPAVIGEGTLAPGSRTVGPGETATGTVEFASKAAPSQVVLMDIGGNVVAASG